MVDFFFCNAGKLVAFVNCILRIVVCLIHLDGGEEEEEETTEHVAGEELPSLAKEVAQVESVRAYAGTLAFHLVF